MDLGVAGGEEERKERFFFVTLSNEVIIHVYVILYLFLVKST